MQIRMKMLTDLNAEHKAMMGLLDTLPMCEASRAKAMSDFVAHLTTNFEDEESYMRICGFPEAKEHEGIHEGIQDYFGKILSSSTPVFCQDLSELKNLLQVHINKEDEKFAKFLTTEQESNELQGYKTT